MFWNTRLSRCVKDLATINILNNVLLFIRNVFCFVSRFWTSPLGAMAGYTIQITKWNCACLCSIRRHTLLIGNMVKTTTYTNTLYDNYPFLHNHTPDKHSFFSFCIKTMFILTNWRKYTSYSILITVILTDMLTSIDTHLLSALFS